MWAKGVTRGAKALGQKVAGVPQDQKETHVADGEGAGRELVSASGKTCWGTSVMMYVGVLCSLKALVSSAVKAAGVFCRTDCWKPVLHGCPLLHGSHCMSDSFSLCSSSLFLAVSSCFSLP